MSQAWSFVVADMLESVLPDREPRAATPGRVTSVFRGETFSAQVAVRPPASGRVLADDVRVELGGTAAPYASVFAVDLVPATLTAFPDHDAHYLVDQPAMLPDVLRPVPDGVVSPIVGSWRSIWLDVVVDEDASLGESPVAELTLEVVLRHVASGDELFRTSLPLRVINQPLPPLDLVNVQWLHADAPLDYYGGTAYDEDHWRSLDGYIGAAARMNITGLLTPVWTPPLDTEIGRRRTPVQLMQISREGERYRFDFTRLGRWLDLLRRHGIAYVEVPHLFTQWGAKATPAIDVTADGELVQEFGWDVAATDPRYRAFLTQLLPELRGYLAEHWDESKIIYHISDEPNEENLAGYRAAREVVIDLLDGCLIADALSDIAFYHSGLVTQPIVATNHAEPFLDADVQPLWLYYCVGQHHDVANRFMAMPPARHRAIGHHLFLTGAKGFLQWGFNFYNSARSLRHIDPFADTCAGGAFPAGDAFIVYPGPDHIVWESTRHRVAAAAFDDHRAMQLLRDRAGRDAVIAIIDPDASVSLTRYPMTAEHYLDTREQINTAILVGEKG